VLVGFYEGDSEVQERMKALRSEGLGVRESGYLLPVA
jgi:hypothetical protein